MVASASTPPVVVGGWVEVLSCGGVSLVDPVPLLLCPSCCSRASHALIWCEEVCEEEV